MDIKIDENEIEDETEDETEDQTKDELENNKDDHSISVEFEDDGNMIVFKVIDGKIDLNKFLSLLISSYTYTFFYFSKSFKMEA